MSGSGFGRDGGTVQKKVCNTCGKTYRDLPRAPEKARWGGDGGLEGLYWECDGQSAPCGSTLFVPAIDLEQLIYRQHSHNQLCRKGNNAHYK
jgi:hypothetical protein